jgi:hypothetical protein
MDIRLAEVDESTGCPIVPGQITLASKIDGVIHEIPDHDRLLFEFMGPRDIVTALSVPTGLVVRLVTGVERLGNDFCKPTVEGPGLFFAGLTPDSIDDLRHLDGDRTLIRGGSKCGGVVSLTRSVLQPLQPFSKFEILAHYTPGGMKLTLCADLAIQGSDTTHDVPQARVEATMSWETMTVAGLEAAASHWKYGPPGKFLPHKNQPNKKPDPKRLQDILISQGLTWPILRGSLDLFPAAPPFVFFFEKSVRFLYTHFQDDRIGFSNAAGVHVLANGFVQTLHGSDCWIDIGTYGGGPFGREWLEEGFRTQDQISLSMAGDGLGRLRYQTGYGLEARDLFGTIHQSIKTLNVRAILTAQGLEISFEGELDDFDPDLIESHRRERRSTLQPLTGFALQATAPWALLLVRRFRFAHKRERFWRLHVV